MTDDVIRVGRGEIDFDVAPLWQTLLKFSVPFLGSSLLQSASPTLMSIVLGRLIGVSALAVISVYFPFGFFLISFVMGIANAGAIMISQARGANDDERVKEIAGTTLSVSLIVGGITAILGSIFTRQILLAANTPPEIFSAEMDYARVMFISQPLVCFYITYTTCMRGTGDTRTPFFTLLFSTALMLILSVLLVKGWIFLPPIGVQAGAYALMASYVISFVATGFYLRRINHPIAPTLALLRHLQLKWPILKTLLRLGVPGGISMVLVSMSEVAVLSLVDQYGAIATAAYGAVNQVVSYVQFPSIAVGISGGIFGARAIGRGEPQRLHEIVRVALRINLIMCGLGIALIYIFALDILSLFVRDAATIETALRLLRITLWAYLFFSIFTVQSNVMRASGTVLPPIFIAVGCIWFIQIPSCYLLAQYFGFGLDGVWYGYDINFTLMMTFMSIYYWVVWRHKKHQAIV